MSILELTNVLHALRSSVCIAAIEAIDLKLGTFTRGYPLGKTISGRVRDYIYI